MSFISFTRQLGARPSTVAPDNLSDIDLLMLLLTAETISIDSLQQTERALKQQGGLRQLLALPCAEFRQLSGLGEQNYLRLQAALELTRRYLEQALCRDNLLESPAQTRLFLQAKLRDCPNEQFACIFLDNRHRIIAFEQLFTGTIHSATVYPRVVVQRSLYHNAAALIFAHNHPSGIAEPSQADIDITQRLKHSLSLIDVRVLDHLIVGDSQITSLAELGEL
ncbi:MAG: DNA repair protein RadC [Gammaproteobacteria bacterium]|nr:DNA repair protein RadC [Gammaproteobacteria bacterium]NVK88480.1 DNA repair protein RadC [Gammaproteobacteria bacterium]